MRLRSQAIRVYKYTKNQGPRFQRNYIIARDQRSDLQGTSFQSSLKITRMLITRPFTYNESLQQPTIAVLLIKILIFLRKTCVASITQRFLLPVSTVSARNAWHNDPLLCPKYDEKRVADHEPRCLRKRD